MMSLPGVPHEGEGASLLERLPAELLEKILMQVVSYKRPFDKLANYDRSMSDDDLARLADNKTLLAHRLVSRTLRKNGWRSLAHVLIDTVFDLSSKDSIENLIMISECEALASWMHRLTIACYTTSRQEYLYDVDDPSSELLCYVDEDTARAVQVHLGHAQENDGWFDAACQRTDGELAMEHSDFYHSEDARNTIGALSQCLLAFKNLTGLRFRYEDDWRPARLQSLASRLPKEIRLGLTATCFPETHHGAIYGQHILLRAAVLAGVKPRHLDLAVDLRQPHSFDVLTPQDEIAGLFTNVETLSLRDRLDYGRRDIPSMSTVLLTKKTFPRLTHLVLDTGSRSRLSIYVSDLLSGTFSTDLPRLLKITMIGFSQSDTKLLGISWVRRRRVRGQAGRRPKVRCTSHLLDLLEVCRWPSQGYDAHRASRKRDHLMSKGGLWREALRP